ncbi:hypothetical protein ASG72_18315 [Bosea sp. Leaf344]|uniref:S8 family serine peptidase n=1 Tax=Bosea sp. Leaf344 TaxID=1736346 RepID=UPI0006FFAA2E|nr:S8 family serine peptidase [Bosea sp. Leaf344]KQU49966.1 hypothetical protein ASG72_18315 [Bosea sp. Leaf344]
MTSRSPGLPLSPPPAVPPALPRLAAGLLGVLLWGAGLGLAPASAQSAFPERFQRGTGTVRPLTRVERPLPMVRQPAVRQPANLPAAQLRPEPGRYPAPREPGMGRPGRPRPGGGWGGVGIGVGAGIIGGILLDQATRPRVYEPEYDEPPPPRYPRRPVVTVEEDFDEPATRPPRRTRPVREAAPPRRTPPRTARPAPGPPAVSVPAVAETRFVPDEILIELAPNAQADTVLRRHRAVLLASRSFALPGVTLIRARLEGGRTARGVLAQMARDRDVAGAQPNYLYALQQPAPGDTAALPPAAPVPDKQPQYIVEKLRLGDLHKLARGEKIRVAVIDSGADQAHPELKGVVEASFDALGGEARPHAHGTAMAAAILAQTQLQGVAPAARLLAARAFSGEAGPAAASGTTFHILTALDWAAGEGARVFNLSFAGPQDRLLSRSLAGARDKGIVAIAAAGNGGAKAAPLYPGADPSVIAVTATDAEDKPFSQASRGSHIAVAAPGVDVLAAEPEGRYAFSSGTSIAAAHVSGIVALLLEKRPDLNLEGVRKLLTESAVDLGSRGRDAVFGAGRVDAPAALARALPVSELGR